MVLNYQKTIAQAFREVSNALIALKKAARYREQQEKLVAAAEDCRAPCARSLPGRFNRISGSADDRFKPVCRSTEPCYRTAKRSVDHRAALRRIGRRLAKLTNYCRVTPPTQDRLASPIQSEQDSPIQ